MKAPVDAGSGGRELAQFKRQNVPRYLALTGVGVHLFIDRC